MTPKGFRARSGLAGLSSSAIAGVLSLVAGLLLLPVVIHTIGAAPYGVWLLLTSLTTIMNYSDLGVGAAIVHFGSRGRAGDTALGTSRDLLTGAIAWTSVAAIIVTPLYACFVLVYADSVTVISESQATLLAGLSIALVFASIILRPFASALVSRGELPRERLYQAIGVLFRIAASLAACLVWNSLELLVVAEAIAIILPLALSAITVLVGKDRPARFRRSTVRVARRMLSFSTRSFLVNLIGVGILQLGTVAVGLILGPAATTYYTAAFRVYTSLRQLLSWLVDPFRSMLSRIRAAGVDVFVSAVYRIGLMVLTVSAIGGAAASAAGPFIVPLWLGPIPDAAAVSVTIAVLASSLSLNAVHLPLIPAGDANGRPGAFAGVQLVWLVLYAIAVYPFTAAFGIVGTAVALAMPLPVVEMLYIWRARSAVGISLREWRARVAAPAMLVLLGGVLGGVLGALPWLWGHAFGSATCALGIGLGGAIAVVLMRHRSEFRDLSHLLREDL